MATRIVVGYDGSAASDAALDAAVALAKSCDGELTVVSGEDRPGEWARSTFRGIPFEMQEWIDDWNREVAADLEKAAERARACGVEVGTACTREHPVDLLLRVARNIGASWIVVGAKGAGTLHAVVMGSTTMKLLHHSEIPVIVVPQHK
jgi:nucleotide-binding universal stress UspA family protein